MVSSTLLFCFTSFLSLVHGLWICFCPHLMILAVVVHCCLNHFLLYFWLLLVSTLSFHAKQHQSPKCPSLLQLKQCSYLGSFGWYSPSAPTNFTWLGSPFFSVLNHTSAFCRCFLNDSSLVSFGCGVQSSLSSTLSQSGCFSAKWFDVHVWSAS